MKVPGVLSNYETIEFDSNKRQVGGNHYRKYGDLQPWDVWMPWNLNGFQANIVKYIVRYRDKDGLRDLEKAKHFLEKLIEIETQSQTKDDQNRQKDI